MHGLLLVIQTISDFLWGTPMTIALIGTGLYLSIKFKFRYITKIKFHFQNTFGKMFKGKGDGEGTVSGFAAACTAMANTIGVGNIGGVATAITMGGPGAIFWMWISALLGMSTKACEIILGQRYRVKYENSMDEYMCDRSFVMKNALGWKKGAFLLAICCFVLGPWTCCVQTESVVNSLKEAFGIKPLFAIIVLGITCSYQASIPGLTENGYSLEEAENLIRSAVKIFCEAREEWWEEEGREVGREWPLCLGAAGPYGAYLADGSEYRGNYGITDEELKEFHKRRVELLHEAGADIILFETVPSLKEAQIEAQIAEEYGYDYWISFSCLNENIICEGTPIAECAKTFAKGHPHLKMIGINCTKPEYITGLIKNIRENCEIPIAVYPNSGEEYDAVKKIWFGKQSALSFEEYAYSYMEAGASAVGGCCTTVAKHVEEVVRAKERFCGK